MPLCMRASCALLAAIPRLPAVIIYFVKSPNRAWSPRQRGGVELARQRVSPPLGEVAKLERDDRQKTDRPARFRRLSLYLTHLSHFLFSKWFLKVY